MPNAQSVTCLGRLGRIALAMPDRGSTPARFGLILDRLVRRDPRYEEKVPEKVLRRRDGMA